MSALVKKVYQLEQQSSKLFKTLVAKDRKIRGLEVNIHVLKKEIGTLQETIKEGAREKGML